jgi:hypothetical protein
MYLRAASGLPFNRFLQLAATFLVMLLPPYSTCVTGSSCHYARRASLVLERYNFRLLVPTLRNSSNDEISAAKAAAKTRLVEPPPAPASLERLLAFYD